MDKPLTPSSAGAVLYEFPRTTSFKNWPFLILIMMMGGCPATFMIMSGAVFRGIVVFAVILSLPLLITLVPSLIAERLGAYSRILRIYQGGIVSRRKGRDLFSTWDGLQLVSDRTIPGGRNRIGGREVTVRSVQENKRTLLLYTKLHPIEAVDFVVARVPPA